MTGVLTRSSGSDLEAQKGSEALQAHTDQDLEKDTDFAERLQSLEVPEGIIAAHVDSRAPSPTSNEDCYDKAEKPESELFVELSKTIDEDKVEQPAVPASETDHCLQITLDEVLAASRAYLRVRNMDCDTVSCISTTRSHGRSILSGVSSIQVTRIGVICLPLYEVEVKRFLDLAFPQGRPMDRVTYPAVRTIQNHLDNLQQELNNSDISASPMGDNLVCSHAYVPCHL